MTISLSQGYTVATALETLQVCILAGASMKEARAFIVAGTPLEKVRATLLARRAEASEPKLNSHHAAKSGNEASHGWDAAVDSVNKTLEPLASSNWGVSPIKSLTTFNLCRRRSRTPNVTR